MLWTEYKIQFCNHWFSLQVFQGVLSLQGNLSIQEVHLFLGRQGDQDHLWFLPCLTVQGDLAHLVVQGVQGGPALLMGLFLQMDPRYIKGWYLNIIMYQLLTKRAMRNLNTRWSTSSAWGRLSHAIQCSRCYSYLCAPEDNLPVSLSTVVLTSVKYFNILE